MTRRSSAAVFVAVLTAPATAEAGAWTQEAGSGQIINTFTYYTLSSGFGPDGEEIDQNRFAKIEYSPYIEYGVTDTLTIGAQPFLQIIEQDRADGSVENAGLADVELFARQRLWEGENAVLSIQGLISVPGGYDPEANLPLGKGHVDVEARVLWGGGHEIKGVSMFYDVAAAYRKRFGGPSDEVHVDVTLGLTPWAGWQFLLQSFNTIGVGKADPGNTTDRGSVLEFDRHKLQLSVVRDLTERVAVQVGGFSEFAGRNTGQGNGGFVALWVNF